MAGPRVGQRATSENAKQGAQPNTPTQPPRPVSPDASTGPVMAEPPKAGPPKAVVDGPPKPVDPHQKNANPLRANIHDLDEKAEGA